MGASDQGAKHTDGRWQTVSRTLCFLCHDDAVLLLRRSLTTRIFPGRYNGVGGHLDRGEDPLTGARREILEETGLTVKDLSLRALYAIDAGENSGITVFVFVGRVDTRDVVDSAEGRLEWVPVDQLVHFPLVEDLYEILPRVLNLPDGARPLFLQMRYNEADSLVLQIVE